MTHIPGAATSHLTKGVHDLREQAAGPARPRGKRSPEGEFGAMLLAGLAALDPLCTAQPAHGAKAARGHIPPPAGRARTSGAGKDAGTLATPQTASSLAAEALARSQADELRTIGKGVSLSALAQAELRGEVSTSPSADTPREGGDTPGSAQASTRAQITERAPTPKHGASEKPAAGPPTDAAHGGRLAPRASLVAAASPVAANALRALDRLSSAASRVSVAQVARGPGAPAAPAFLGGVTAAAKAAAFKTADTAPSQGGPTAAARGIGALSAEARSAGPRPMHTARTAETPRPSPAAQAQFTAQVHRALGQALQARDGVVTIHLTPEHLGHLRVDLSRGEGGVSARFEARTAEARGLLERSLPELKAALEARGLHVDRLDVRLNEPPATERAGNQEDPPSQDAGGSPGRDGPQQESGASQDQHGNAPERGRSGPRHRDRPGHAGSNPRAEPEPSPIHAAETAWGVSTIELVV